MFAYSAMKNRVNGPAAYSTLKPETSSDSPSVRSNGAWFVSASVEINHIIARGHAGKISPTCSCVVIRVERVKDPLIRRTDSRIIASVTLYEIVCATASWETCRQVRKQQLELNMEQQTGSKKEKEYVKAVYCHPAYLTSMQSTSWETLGCKKHKLESRLPGEISITSDMQMTPPLWQKVKKK